MMRANKLILRAGKIQEMSAERVQELLGAERYQEIKRRDSHPFFVELLVAHEGVSQGKILNVSWNRLAKKRWSAERIKELVGKLSSVPVYLFHNSDNRPRQKVGEVVSAYWKKIQGAVCAIALSYISDPRVREMLRRGELDTCSLEAELVFEPAEERKGLSEWLVNSIEKVSGLALGSRAIAKPGFARAGVLGQVEEFVAEALSNRASQDEELWRPKENNLNEADDFGQMELEQRLKEKDQELIQLKAELARYQKEREQEERKQRVRELVERFLKGRNLRREEERHLLAEVSERIGLKGIEKEHLESEVKKETELELSRLYELKRIYQKNGEVKVSREPGSGKTREGTSGFGRNPLIPEED